MVSHGDCFIFSTSIHFWQLFHISFSILMLLHCEDLVSLKGAVTVCGADQLHQGLTAVSGQFCWYSRLSP